ACGAVAADAPKEESVPLVGRYVAIDNVCAWPNLKMLADGTIVATIFGQPSHGRLEGDVECWASSDGRFWNRRSVAARHEPSANRMNVAVGFDREGKLLVLASGWSLKREGDLFVLGEVLPTLSARSPDARDWTVHENALPPSPEGAGTLIPFGDIFVAADGSLRVSCYAKVTAPAGAKPKNSHRSWVCRSDDGNRWTLGSVIGPVHNETTLFYLGGENWLAAARREYVELFRSEDDGASWQSLGPVTQRNEINAHLQKLADGRLLLTFGRRIKGRFGVGVRLSSDEGKSWGPPMTLVNDLLTGDCGYPSSVERRDGTIVTAYYASASPDHQRYHMGVALWKPPAK
ncbi:MAG TPA: sialidase family protein, partial [Pirellulales bacterium]|nr:sialidase family protein [Pirellulales bacterium]